MRTSFEAKTLDKNSINNGWRFVNGDGLDSETVNSLIESVIYLQENGSSSSGTSQYPTATKGLVYGLHYGEYWCEGIGTATDTDIVIAREIDGIPVRAVQESAFEGSNITSVYFPDTITAIGTWAFWGCRSLKKVSFNSAIYFNNESFLATALSKIEIPTGSHITSDVFPWGIKAIVPQDTILDTTAFYGDGTKIYTDATERPRGWDENWNGFGGNANNAAVIWGAALDIYSINDKFASLEAKIAELLSR